MSIEDSTSVPVSKDEDPAEAEESLSIVAGEEGRDLVANPQRHIAYDPEVFRRDPNEDLWVFGYGSLIWNPGFRFVEQRKAELQGYHRAFCIKSEHYRGTAEQPGLVLGLDEGGSCLGIAFRIAEDEADIALPYLWDREMVTMVYRPAKVSLRLLQEDAAGKATWNQSVSAFTFVARPDHRQYYAGKDPKVIAGIVRQAVGSAGPNWDYLCNTADHLRQLDLADPMMEALITGL